LLQHEDNGVTTLTIHLAFEPGRCRRAQNSSVRRLLLIASIASALALSACGAPTIDASKADAVTHRQQLNCVVASDWVTFPAAFHRYPTLHTPAVAKLVRLQHTPEFLALTHAVGSDVRHTSLQQLVADFGWDPAQYDAHVMTACATLLKEP
jgi:hypothetical protein